MYPCISIAHSSHTSHITQIPSNFISFQNITHIQWVSFTQMTIAAAIKNHFSFQKNSQFSSFFIFHLSFFLPQKLILHRRHCVVCILSSSFGARNIWGRRLRCLCCRETFGGASHAPSFHKQKKIHFHSKTLKNQKYNYSFDVSRVVCTFSRCCSAKLIKGRCRRCCFRWRNVR